MTELGPVSQAILDYVNETVGFLKMYRLIREVAQETGVSHTQDWYFRRLVALALEGRINAKVFRDGERVAVMFRRLSEFG